MSNDDFSVFIDFTNLPTAFSQEDWEDITDAVNAVSVQRGKDYERDAIKVGTATLQIDNSDGAFDPDNTDSPYSPGVTPLRRIKIGRGYTVEVLKSSPKGFWRLGSDGARDYMGNRNGTVSGTSTTGAGIATQRAASVSVSGDNYIVAPLDDVDLTSYSLEIWCQPNDVASLNALFRRDELTNLNISSSRFNFAVLNTTGGNYQLTQTASGSVVTGQTYHVVATFDSDVSKLYVNGAISASATATNGSRATTGVSIAIPGYGLHGYSGKAQYAAIYGRALTADEVAAHYAAADGPDKELFNGFVENWPTDWGSHFRSVINVRCIDALGYFQRMTLPSWYDLVARSGSPVAYYKFDDEVGEVCNDELGQNDGTYTVALGTTGQCESVSNEHDDSASVRLTPLYGDSLGPGINLPFDVASPQLTTTWPSWTNTGASGFTVDGYVSVDAYPTTTGIATSPISVFYMQGARNLTDDEDGYGFIGVNASGKALCFLNGLGGFMVTGATLPLAPTGTMTHFAWVVDNLGASGLTLPTMHIYINGTKYSQGGAGTTSIASPLAPGVTGGAALGKVTTDYVPSDSLSWPTGIPQFGYLSGRLDDVRICHYPDYDGVETRALDRTTQGEYLTGEALRDFYLPSVNWPDELSEIDTGTTYGLSRSEANGKTLLGLIQEQAAREGGLAYVNDEGRLIFLDRFYRVANTETPYTLGDGTDELPYTRIEIERSTDLVFNEVEVRTYDGSPVKKRDFTSQQTYLVRKLSSPMTPLTKTAAAQAATWELSFYKDPVSRIKRVTLEPRSSDELWLAALDLDVNKRATVIRRPPEGATVEKDCIVEGIKYTLNAARSHSIELSLSPANAIPLFVLDDPIYGRLDEDNRLFW